MMTDGDKRPFTFLSKCEICGQQYYDPDGNREDSTILCDKCRRIALAIKVINDFLDGIEYESPFSQHAIKFYWNELIKKHGPKSEVSYHYIEFHIGDEIWFSGGKTEGKEDAGDILARIAWEKDRGW